MFIALVLGVSVYISSILVIRSIGVYAPITLENLFIAVFYVNTINLLYTVFLVYIYVRYNWLFIGLLALFVRFFGRTSREYSYRVSRLVYDWSIRNAGFIVALIVATIFIGSLWKMKLLLGFSYPIAYAAFRLLLMPHTIIELIAFYIALWGTIRMHYQNILVIGVSLTSTIMLLAAAIFEAYVSPVLLYS